MNDEAVSLSQSTASFRHRLATVAWLLTGGYLILLAWLCLAPDPWWILTLFGAPGREMEASVDSTLADYIQHGLVFAVLGLMVYGARWLNRWPDALNCGLALTTYALLMECLQAFVPLRTFSLWDALANLVGVWVGWFAAAWSAAIARRYLL